jgi:hypothetical protein
MPSKLHLRISAQPVPQNDPTTHLKASQKIKIKAKKKRQTPPQQSGRDSGEEGNADTTPTVT